MPVEVAETSAYLDGFIEYVAEKLNDCEDGSFILKREGNCLYYVDPEAQEVFVIKIGVAVLA